MLSQRPLLDAGRDPLKLQLIVRANVHEKPRAMDGAILTGPLAQINEDVEWVQGSRRA